MTSINPSSLINWKNLWQEIGEPYLLAKKKDKVSPIFKWPKSAIDIFSEAGKKRLNQKRDEITSIIEKSKKKLDPLGEPLELDLGIHRRLNSEREEAYSDWLAWILSHLTSGELIDLFCIPQEKADLITNKVSLALEIIREHSVNNDKGEPGRIDVLVKLPDDVVLVLELKKGSIHNANTAKQETVYFPAMEKTNKDKCHYVLLVTDTDKTGEEVHKFTVRDYASFCIKLRYLAVEKIKSKEKQLILVAMILAFVGAIESNLLGLAITNGLPSEAILKHLKTFLGK